MLRWSRWREPFAHINDSIYGLGNTVHDMHLARPGRNEVLLRLRKLLTLALHFEQDVAATKTYNEIDRFLDVIAARADLFQCFDEFVLIVIGTGGSPHFVLFYILVKPIMREHASHVLGGPASGSHFI
jgi:hypothetical protein